MTYARLTGDFTPVHVDEEYAKTTPFGTRVAHGLLGLSLADGLKTQADYRFLPGMSLGWTWDFKLPIKIGDTLHVKFSVGSMRTTKRPGWGIVVLPSELINQRGEVVQTGEHRLMIPRRPGADALSDGRRTHRWSHGRWSTTPRAPCRLNRCRSPASASSTTAIFSLGPFLSRCLAAMGAEVIKVERPKAGDAGRAHPYFIKGQSGYSCSRTWGSRACASTSRIRRGLEMMHKLTDTADVFVENYRPGALEQLGLGYKELSARNPKLVYCSVSAYGHTCPYSAQPGFGLIAEAKSGAMAMIGVPGEPPPLFRIALADMYTGIHGVAAVCAALLGRADSGRGQHIDMALYDRWSRCTNMRCSATRCRAARKSPSRRPRPAAVDGLRGILSARRVFRNRCTGRRCVEASGEADRRRCACGRRALPQSLRAQRASRGDSCEGPRVGDGAAFGWGLPGRAAGPGALREGSAHRRGACGSADHRPRDDSRAGPSRTRKDPDAQSAVQVLGMRHVAEERGAIARTAVSSDRCVAGIYLTSDIDAMVRDGVLYAEEAVDRLDRVI